MEIREAADLLTKILEEKGNDQKDLKAQYTVTESETREITMDNGEFSLFRTLFDKNASVSVIAGQKPGKTATNQLEEESLKQMVEDALTAAASGVAEPYYDIAPGMKPEAFSYGALEPDVDKLLQRGAELAKEIKDHYPKIMMRTMTLKYVRSHSIYRNTGGSEDEVNNGYYALSLMFAGHEGDKTTGIAGSGVMITDLDTPFIELGSVRKELENAQNSLDPMTLEGKFEGPVIFTPDCFAQVLYYGLGVLITDGVILEQTSLWKDKVGEKVATDLLTVSTKPWDERIVAHEVHTADGFRSEDADAIKNGVLQGFCVGLYTANKCKVERAKNSGFDLVVEPGNTALSDMIAGVKKGLMVGSVSCGRPSANTELAGVAKNAFYVEDGKIVNAVMETMISFKITDLLQNITEISKEVLCDGGMVVPYVKAEHVLISGK